MVLPIIYLVIASFAVFVTATGVAIFYRLKKASMNILFTKKFKNDKEELIYNQIINK
jgi:hypothetical protein